MDRTDLIIALNEQDEYRPHQQAVEELVSMLRNSGQDDEIRDALARGETVESLAEALGQIWDVDPDTLAEAIQRALAEH